MFSSTKQAVWWHLCVNDCSLSLVAVGVEALKEQFLTVTRLVRSEMGPKKRVKMTKRKSSKTRRTQHVEVSNSRLGSVFQSVADRNGSYSPETHIKWASPVRVMWSRRSGKV